MSLLKEKFLSLTAGAGLLLQVLSLVMLSFALGDLRAHKGAWAAVQINLAFCGWMAVINCVLSSWYWRAIIRGRLKTFIHEDGEKIEMERLPKGEVLDQLDFVLQEVSDKLSEILERERAIADFAPDVLCALDKQGRMAAVSPSSLKVWGYQPSFLLGRSIKVILPETDSAKVLALLAREEDNLFPASVETGLRKRDAANADMSWYIDWSASENAYFCVVCDITQRKQLERVKREFVSMISHDLRTPLTSLQASMGALESGLYGPLNEKGKKTVATAERNIQRLVRLIGDLLDLDKSEEGRLSLSVSSFELDAVFKAAVEAVCSFAEEQEVSLSCASCPETVIGDFERTVQVLINLLSNAIKFSPKNSIVHISGQAKDRLVEVRIKDEGRGIPESHLSTVFDRYKQVQPGDKVERQGSGLGLAICKTLVEAQKGVIGVESVEGKGSTFWFRLPKPLL